MIEIILEAISYVFIELIFKGVKWLGLITLKIVTLNKDSMETLKKKYKGAVLPYFIGLSILIASLYSIIQ